MGTLNLAATLNFDESLKAILSYEFVNTVGGASTVVAPKDNIITVRMQARFQA